MKQAWLVVRSLPNTGQAAISSLPQELRHLVFQRLGCHGSHFTLVIHCKVDFVRADLLDETDSISDSILCILNKRT